MISEYRVFYLHGLPGSSQELCAAGLSPRACDAIVTLDRMARFTADQGWEAALLDAFDQAYAEHGRRRVHLVGFSLGAMPTLLIAAQRPDAVAAVDLISPAAPLELGTFLPRMAGAPVFKAAQRGDAALRRLGDAQSWILKLAPALLLRLMFARSAAAERRLLRESPFREALYDGLKRSLGPYRRAYEAELKAYVAGWSDRLNAVTLPVRLWHGDADDWAPLDMAQRLAERLPAGSVVNSLPGAGHFGALRRALPLILEPSFAAQGR